MTDDIIFNGKRYLDMKNDFNEDCKDSGYDYIPHVLKPTSRTIAIGDIHGDLDVAIKMLETGKCIQKVSNIKNKRYVTVKDRNNNDLYFIWIGNDTQVVQVGDQIDRCRPVNGECIYPQATTNDEASDIKILNFYSDVDKIARYSNGRVISLLGNHELMNVLGKMRYVSFMGLMEFSSNVNLADLNIDNYLKMDQNKLSLMIDDGLKNRKKAFSNIPSVSNNGLNKFLGCSRTSSIIIGSLLFVHGGMIKKMAEAYHLDDLNKIVRKWLLGKLTNELENKKLLYTNQERLEKKGLTFNFKQRLMTLLSDDNSIFWNRILGNLPADLDINEEDIEDINKKCDDYLNGVFNIYDINGIIIGHTPQMSAKYGINSACNKKVWRVDIGASGAFDSFRSNKKRIEVLEITYNSNKAPTFKVLSYDNN